MVKHDLPAVLQAEIVRLIALLEQHGIEWRLPPDPAASVDGAIHSGLSSAEKIALFRRLFRGRSDVYPSR
jgi:hypothetical protein